MIESIKRHNVAYEWMFGIKAYSVRSRASPCLPDGMDHAEAEFEYMGKKLSLKVECGTVFVDGKEITEKTKDLITDKEVWLIKA